MVQFNVSVTLEKHTKPKHKLELELEERMSKILAEEIDWELISEMMVSAGWTIVNLSRFKDRYHAIDIDSWIEENCSGKHMKRSKTYVFEKSQDAEWFSLRWL